MLHLSQVCRKGADAATTAITRTLLSSHGLYGPSPLAVFGKAGRSRSGEWCLLGANLLCVLTYCIMVNWVYEGYVDLWYGVYGLDDEEDDDD